MKFKVCGLQQVENILEVAEANPDYMGFIFYPKSPRFYSEKKLPNIPKNIAKVGVFVNASEGEIATAITQYDLQAIQLHGEETVAFCEALRKYEVTIIKVFSVAEASDLAGIEAYENCCDYFLFDTKGKYYGGNGLAFEWNILKNYTSTKPIILSGGIGIEDIAKIKTLPYAIHAIDVNSKFEITTGLKNIPLIQQLKNEIHSR